MFKFTIEEDPRLHSQGILDYLSAPNSYNRTSDVTIYCEDGIMFSHRLVLASLSDFLGIILVDSSLDKNISLILPDFSVELVLKYVKWIYNKNSFTEDLLQLDHIFKRKASVVTKTETEEIDPNILNDSMAAVESEEVKSESFSIENMKRIDDEDEEQKKKMKRSAIWKIQRSSVWKHCKRYPSKDLMIKWDVHCNYCNYVLKGRDGVIKTLRNHMVKNHHEILTKHEYEELLPKSEVDKVDVFKNNANKKSEVTITIDDSEMLESLLEDSLKHEESIYESYSIENKLKSYKEDNVRRKWQPPKILKSAVWKHCKKINGDVHCNYCSSFNSKDADGVVSTIRRHMVKNHQDILSDEDLRELQPRTKFQKIKLMINY